jgi:hypothetical protein
VLQGCCPAATGVLGTGAAGLMTMLIPYWLLLLEPLCCCTSSTATVQRRLQRAWHKTCCCPVAATSQLAAAHSSAAACCCAPVSHSPRLCWPVLVGLPLAAPAKTSSYSRCSNGVNSCTGTCYVRSTSSCLMPPERWRLPVGQPCAVAQSALPAWAATAGLGPPPPPPISDTAHMVFASS